jgi:molybdopterin molybdotransferase
LEENMPEFLTLLCPKEALTRWLPAFGEAVCESEEIEAILALGRVTSGPVVAHHPLPDFPRSTMDGYAVHAVDTFGASDGLPAYFALAGEVPMGGQPVFALKPGQAALIHTGGMLPEHADAVVMLEYTQSAREGEVEILRAVAPAENVIRVGEDVQTGQMVIPAGVRLRPAEIGGLAALGLQKIQVVRQPRIGIISSGDEVVPLEATLLPGQVRDINSHTLSALIVEKGGLPIRFGIMPDDVSALRTALQRALHESDAVIITAGSSASIRDLTAQVIQQSGAPGVLVHGVNVRPGKPTILAVCDRKPVVGLPGNPVSALVIAGLFVTPMLERLLGLQHPRPQAQVTARLNLNIPSQTGREDWIPVTLSGDPDDFLADPIFFKSNLIFNLVRADGLLYIPADATGLAAGEIVRIYLL